MSKLTTIQSNAVNAYASFLNAGMSYGEAMRKAAQSLGETPCPTFIAALAQVHATKYQCNYTWNSAGRAVFHTGAESTRESRHDSATKSWQRNVMVWFTPEKPKATPAKSMRIQAAQRKLAIGFLSNFDGETLDQQIKAAIALLKAVA